MTGDFRIGEWIVQPQLNCLRNEEKVFRLEPKVMQVLVQLAAHPEEVLSKERLIQTVWPDTFVGDHVVTRCISELRRIFNDDAREPRFIQSIPKVGYRLIAPVQPTVAAEPPGVTNAERSTQSGEHAKAEVRKNIYAARRFQIASRFVILLACLIVISLALWVILSRSRKATVSESFKTVPFASYPGSETQPAISPDGTQIAFVWNERGDSLNLFVKQIGSETPLRLTSHTGQDLSPAWSPDGRSVAFIRRSEGGDAIYIIPAIGGSERKIYSLHRAIYWDAPGLSWSTDGERLIFPDAASSEDASAIYSLALKTLNLKMVTVPPSSWDGDFNPVFSPDGKKIAFVRGSDTATRNIYVVDSNGGEPKQLTFDGRIVVGLTWTADSSAVVFSSDRGGTLSLWEISSAGGTPEHLAVGGDNAVYPAISRTGRRMAYSQGSATWSIMRIDLQSAQKKTIRLISSKERESAARYSPDGRFIAFQSYRSGSQEIWTSNSDGSNPLKLTSFDGPLTGSPSWSPDGVQIAFDSRPAGRSHIYAMKAAGGIANAITDGDYNDVVPSWSADGEWVYFGSKRSGIWQIWKIVARTGELRQVTRNGGFVANESIDGKWVYYTKYQVPGLWRMPVGGGEEAQVLRGPPAAYWDYWSLTSDGVYYLDLAASRASISFFSFGSNTVTPVYFLQHKPTPSAGITVSKDRHWLLFSDEEDRGSNIRLVENFR